MRRVLAVMLLCAGAALGTPAVAANSCLAQAGDNHLSLPGKPYVIAVKPDPTFGFALSICSPTDLDISWLTSYGFGDFNHDGSEDLMFGTTGTSGGGVEVLINDATGSGTVVLNSTLSTGAGAGPDEVQALDLDGDGWDDILTANGSDGTFSVMLNDGSGGFLGAQQYTMASDVAILAAADVNGDGYPDVITESSVDQTVSVRLNNGDGSFAAPVIYSLGGLVGSLSVADVNGDGHPDILVSSDAIVSLYQLSSGTGATVKMLNNGDGTFSVSSWAPDSSVGSTISLSGSGVDVTVSAVNLVATLGNLSGSQTSTGGVTVVSGGKIKLPPASSPGTATSSGGKTGSTGGKTAASGGGGAMEWLSLVLLGIVGLLRRKSA